MKNSKSIILSYYLVLGMLVLISVVNTIYQGSLRVAYGKKVAHLENKKTILTLDEKNLEQQLSSKLSLAYLEDSLDTDQYQTIKPSLVIETQNTVALR